MGVLFQKNVGVFLVSFGVEVGVFLGGSITASSQNASRPSERTLEPPTQLMPDGQEPLPHASTLRPKNSGRHATKPPPITSEGFRPTVQAGVSATSATSRLRAPGVWPVLLVIGALLQA